MRSARGWRGLALLVMAAATLKCCVAQKLTDEHYHLMPRLFHLDEMDKCLAQPGGLYCLGTFDLQPQQNIKLFDLLVEYSSYRHHFNRTQLYRGLCVSARCGSERRMSSSKQFARCVAEWSTRAYGLDAKLRQLEYCRGAHALPPQLTSQHLAFLAVVAVLLLFNAMGTLYDFFFRSGKNGSPLVLAWSVRDNLQRLVVQHDADPRLTALRPLQGLKTLTLLCVMLAHTAFAYYMTYAYNPRFLEKVQRAPLTALLQNGTVIVQTFVMLATFLLTYNLVLYAEDHKKPLSLARLPSVIFLRLARIAPVNMLVVWWAMTWWPLSSDGPMWAPLVEREAERCRNNWWAHFLFINNFIRPHNRCLIQTWFLAVDVQLYVVAAVLVLMLGRRPRTALVAVSALWLLAIIVNYVIVNIWDLKAMVFLMSPERLRVQFAGEPSYAWLYAAPWGSLPTALAGVALAFLYHRLQQNKFDPRNYWWVVPVYRSSVPMMFFWIISGWYIQDATSPTFIALYSVLDRPIFILIDAIVTLGLLYKIDELWWKFMSWRIWEVFGRMSLSALMVHWSYTLSFLAFRPQPGYTSVLDIGTSWLGVIAVTYAIALPVHLLLEAPAYRFLRALAG